MPSDCKQTTANSFNNNNNNNDNNNNKKQQMTKLPHHLRLHQMAADATEKAYCDNELKRHCSFVLMLMLLLLLLLLLLL